MPGRSISSTRTPHRDRATSAVWSVHPLAATMTSNSPGARVVQHRIKAAAQDGGLVVGRDHDGDHRPTVPARPRGRPGAEGVSPALGRAPCAPSRRRSPSLPWRPWSRPVARCSPRSAATTSADVGTFLHAHLNPRRQRGRLGHGPIVPTWTVDAPNHGFLLRHDGRIVGVQLAFYSRREVDGRRRGLLQPRRLVRARALPQPGGPDAARAAGAEGLHVHRPLAERQRRGAQPSGWASRPMDTTTSAACPNLPVTLPRATRVVTDPEAIARPADRRGADDLRRPPSRGGGDPPRPAPGRRALLRDRSAGTAARICRCSPRSCTSATRAAASAARRTWAGTCCSTTAPCSPWSSCGCVGRPARPRPGAAPRRGRRCSAAPARLPARAIDDLYSELALVAW